MKFLLFILFSVPAFASSADSLGNFSYQITVPENWTVKEGCKEIDCSFLAPQDNNQDTFLENINIVIIEAPAKNYPSEKYADFSIGYLPSVIDKFELIGREKLKENATFLIFKGIKGDFAQTWKQYYFVKNTQIYILTFAAESEKFEEYITKIQPNIDSFKVK